MTSGVRSQYRNDFVTINSFCSSIWCLINASNLLFSHSFCWYSREAHKVLMFDNENKSYLLMLSVDCSVLSSNLESVHRFSTQSYLCPRNISLIITKQKPTSPISKWTGRVRKKDAATGLLYYCRKKVAVPIQHKCNFDSSWSSYRLRVPQWPWLTAVMRRHRMSHGSMDCIVNYAVVNAPDFHRNFQLKLLLLPFVNYASVKDIYVIPCYHIKCHASAVIPVNVTSSCQRNQFWHMIVIQ